MLRSSHVVGGATMVLALCASQTALAAEYFVATNGNDSNPGSESQPFQTIRRGVSAATSPGDTVYIRGGTYGGGWDNQLNPTNSGTSGSPITFAAYPGEVPILDGSSLGEACGVEPNSQAVQYVRIIGLVARNWGTSGFSNGWNYPSSNLQFINCVAENNGVNGITFYNADNVTIEGCISAHNGNQQPSWSSGINIYGGGGQNVIRGNVSFENIDISSHASDGNGFILDESSTHGLFENNIAFLNGGSCMRLTRSSGGRLINNTCVLNGQDDTVDFNDEIYASDSQSTTRMTSTSISA